MAGSSSRFDPHFTQNVLNAIGPKATPRNREVLGALITHIHDFAREVELTVDEWMLGVKFINEIGQISTPVRNEGQRVSDVIGLESVVDEIAHAMMTDSGDTPTSSSILGPFWSPNAPFREVGGSIIQDGVPPGGQVTLMYGTVTDLVTKKGIPDAVVDIWQASANGKYDFQDPENQTDNNLRGKFRTDSEGRYHFFCLKPTAYSLPTDGPAGVLLNLLDRHPMRPAHIHLMVSQSSYLPVTTQIYPREDPYLATDSVFAVKDDLIIDFEPITPAVQARHPKNTTSAQPTLQMEYNIILAPKELHGKHAKKETTTVATGLGSNGVEHPAL